MSHLEFAELESLMASGTSADHKWEAYCRAFERAIGGNCDGCGDENGYSLDELYEAWEAGQSVAQYVAIIKARPNFAVRDPKVTA
jgi:hypothetical protein